MRNSVIETLTFCRLSRFVLNTEKWQNNTEIWERNHRRSQYEANQGTRLGKILPNTVDFYFFLSDW